MSEEGQQQWSSQQDSWVCAKIRARVATATPPLHPPVCESIVRKTVLHDVTCVPEVGRKDERRSCVCWHSEVSKRTSLLFKIRNGVKWVAVVSHGEDNPANITDFHSVITLWPVHWDVFVGCDILQYYRWYRHRRFGRTCWNPLQRQSPQILLIKTLPLRPIGFLCIFVMKAKVPLA